MSFGTLNQGNHRNNQGKEYLHHLRKSFPHPAPVFLKSNLKKNTPLIDFLAVPHRFTWHSGILVPGPGIEPTPPAMEARSLNHWIAREVPAPVS